MRFLAILTVKNEGPFLIEWLAHARATGFTDILAFSNDCEDGTEAMLDRLATMGWLTHLPNPGPHAKGPQWDALKAADRHPLRQAADWIMVLDVDEFVNVHVGDRTLPALLAAVPEATAIPLTWRLFGNAGVVRFEDRPVTQQFTRAAPAVMGWPWRAAMFKTLFHNDGTYGKLGVHRPRAPDHARLGAQRWFDGSGRELPPAYRNARVFSPFGRDNYHLAQLNHYPLGAMESYLVKCDRGRANRDASTFDMGYWVERNLCAEEDRSISAIEPRAAPLRAELLADPVLGHLHRAAVAWRQTRIRELLSKEPWRALLGRMMMAGESRALSPEASGYLLSHAQPPEQETGGSADAD